MVQWEADERTLLAAVAKASNKTGYFGVYSPLGGECDHDISGTVRERERLWDGER